GQERCEVVVALEACQLVEAGGQGRGEQEREKHLDARLDDTDLLKQFDEVAIAPFQLRLVAPGRVIAARTARDESSGLRHARSGRGRGVEGGRRSDVVPE